MKLQGDVLERESIVEVHYRIGVDGGISETS